MTKEDAVRIAVESVQAAPFEVGEVVDAWYLDLNYLDEKARGCPSDLLETYHSVRKSFRNHWVVSFGREKVSGQVSCPETHTVSVSETGEVTMWD